MQKHRQNRKNQIKGPTNHQTAKQSNIQPSKQLTNEQTTSKQIKPKKQETNLQINNRTPTHSHSAKQTDKQKQTDKWKDFKKLLCWLQFVLHGNFHIQSDTLKPYYIFILLKRQ